MRPYALLVLALLVPGCGKSGTCKQLADRNHESADAIEAVILDDYSTFAEYAEKNLGRTPPPGVREKAEQTAKTLREGLTDPMFADTCVTDRPDAEVQALATCLEQPDEPAYAECILDQLGVPRLGRDL